MTFTYEEMSAIAEKHVAALRKDLPDCLILCFVGSPVVGSTLKLITNVAPRDLPKVLAEIPLYLRTYEGDSYAETPL